MCAYGGYMYSRRYVYRQQYFNGLLQFCERLISDIRFSHISLYIILEKNADSFKGLLSQQLCGISRLLSDNRSTDEETLSEYVAQGVLTDAEYTQIIRFFSVLGKSDADNQTASVESYAAQFKIFHQEADEKKKKYSSLYWKLGLLAGAAIAVFII